MELRRFTQITASVAALALACIVWAAKTDRAAEAISPATDASEPAPPADVVTGHQESPGGAFKPVPPSARRTSPAARVLRNGYESVQVNVDENGDNIIGDAANEPSIAVDPTDPNKIVIGWRQFDTISSNFRQGGYGHTKDGGRSWTFPGVIFPGEFSSDPVLEVNSAGEFYYYSLQSDRGPGDWPCYLYKSFDSGATWPQDHYGWGGDKEWIAMDRTGGVGDGNFYSVWSSYFTCCDGQFTRSTDGGVTFMDPIWVPDEPMWGTITVGPDGEVYVSGYDYWSSTYVVARSDDAQNPAVTPTFPLNRIVDFGGTWQDHDGPNPGGLLTQVWVVCDHSDGPTRGNVYMLCCVNPPGSDPDDVMFVASTDGGSTWSSPKRINDDTGNAWQWFGAISVAPDGRIDVTWNDTRNDPGGNDSELYYSYSTDAGQTWSVNEPVSPAFDPHLGWPDQNKIGDYIGMTSDLVGCNVAYPATFNGEQDVYYLRIGDYDCNGNGIGDAQDIADGTSTDLNGNGIPDECECVGDTNGDGIIDVLDLLNVLSAWDQTGDPGWIAEDINGDGTIDVLDLLAVLSSWGPCG